MLYISGAACKEKWKNLRAVFVRHMKPAPSGSGAKKKQYYLTDCMQFILPYVKTSIPLHASNLPERNTMNLEEETETGDEPTMEQDSEASSNEASNYQPNNPFFEPDKSNSNVTEIISPSAEVPQPQISSTPQTTVNKRKRPLDEVDKTFVNYMKERQRQGTEAENTRRMFLLSLLDEVTNMSNEQWRLFKRRTLHIIDEIMTPSRTYINQFEDSLQASSCVSRESFTSYSNSNSQLSFPSNNNQVNTYSADTSDPLLQNTYITGQNDFST